MVEVFKTNVQKNRQAKEIVDLLRYHFPASKINFDLEDCDKILRIEGHDFTNHKVRGLVEQRGFVCMELE